MMPVAALEKLAFGAPILILYFQGRAALAIVGAAVIDLILGALSCCRSGRPASAPEPRRRWRPQRCEWKHVVACFR
jgi:hypothetical protein